MRIVAILIFVIGLPIVGIMTIAFARRLLMDEIPKIDGDLVKTRTDIYAVRAAFACFMLGLSMLAVWACGVAVLGVIAGIRLLWVNLVCS
jgi:hypothetical protein